MMRSIAYFFSLFLFLNSYANGLGQSLQVEKEGLIVVVIDFQEGDKLKLFEVESGDHVLSKTRGQIDLSQLPMGAYLLENSIGESIVIQRLEGEVIIEGGIVDNEEQDFVVEEDSKRLYMSSETTVEQEYIQYYENEETNLLEIIREGDIVTVVDFEVGDKIKLFEVKNTVHVLSKTTNYIDLSQLPTGVYVLENNKGESVIVEKFLNKKELVVDM
ncbi:hypothetical protein [Aquimarina muelleri]|uniref:Por secretion system C-terminal sorting domain-containing protein n=2 Tax=Aquimarina muelleri TaxID=279356 RepID=A0A918N382_9FLAO|nr:hypothetical protein [Aquimarina muelleri]MCX2761187.1 T9SS type A sorting domain-containing protein [Aquimarina muelleri]GGX08911.1 hypothetical protein GCM10007384_08390 [Aquimarina muelleri]